MVKMLSSTILLSSSSSDEDIDDHDNDDDWSADNDIANYNLTYRS